MVKSNGIPHKSLLWERVSISPFLSPNPKSLAEEAVTTPDVLTWKDRLYLYVGAIKGGQERLLVTPLQPGWLDGKPPDSWAAGAEIAIDTGPHRFDRLHVFDPASLVVDDTVFLYYSAVGPEGDVLGMASSSDGVHFLKRESPLLEGRAPEIIYFDGRYYLFYVKLTSRDGYAIFSSFSTDGEHFSPVSVAPVLDVGASGTWDGFEVTTPRIFQRSNTFYMLYSGGGDPALKDIPQAFGLARSSDLITWERYPGNPVFRKGIDGSWDDGAIWFGTVFAWEDQLYLIYEGGSAEAIQEPGPALTQVGLAAIAYDTFDTHMALWTREG